jgi:hypothetical protein
MVLTEDILTFIHALYTRDYPKIRGIHAQGDGGNKELGKKLFMVKFPEFLGRPSYTHSVHV